MVLPVLAALLGCQLIPLPNSLPDVEGADDTAGGTEEASLTIVAILARNQTTLLGELDTIELVVGDSDSAGALDLGDPSAGQWTTSVSLTAGASLSLVGKSGGETTAIGHSAPLSLDDGDVEVEILLARVGSFAELTELDEGRGLGALVATEDGGFHLIGGVEGGMEDQDTDLSEVLTLDLASAALGFEGTGVTLPSLEGDDGSLMGHTATMLSQGSHGLEGQVLIVGGAALFDASASNSYTYTGESVTYRVMLHDPVTGWTEILPDTDALIKARALHTAHELPSGDVIVVGGVGPSDPGIITFEDSAEIFNPDLGHFEVIDGEPEGPLFLHAAARLGSDELLVCGGVDFQGGDIVLSQSCDIVARTAQAWTEATPLPIPLVHHAMAPLPDGRVLVAGGVDSDHTDSSLWGFEGEAATSTAWITDGFSWIETGSLQTARAMHAMVPLDNGDVLVVGGVSEIAEDNSLLYGSGAALPCAELYVASQGEFLTLGSCDVDVPSGALSQAVAAPMTATHPLHGVLVAGGLDRDEDGGVGVSLYVPVP